MLVARASARPKAFPSGVRDPVTPTAVPATKKATVLAAANAHLDAARLPAPILGLTQVVREQILQRRSSHKTP